MENKNSTVLLALIVSAALIAAYSVFKPTQHPEKELLPPHDYSLKVQNQVIKGYRKPAMDKKGLQKIKQPSADSSSATALQPSSRKKRKNNSNNQVRIENSSTFEPNPFSSESSSSDSSPAIQGDNSSDYVSEEKAGTSLENNNNSNSPVYSGSAPYPVATDTQNTGTPHDKKENSKKPFP